MFHVHMIEKYIDEKDSTRNHIVVKLDKADKKRHTYDDDSFIVFKEIKGMVELNDLPPLPIQVINGFSFKIFIDPTNFGDYTYDGQMTEVKIPKKLRANSLETALINPLETAFNGMFYIFDLAAFERPGQLHLAMQGV